jgi:hypothetical protein
MLNLSGLHVMRRLLLLIIIEAIVTICGGFRSLDTLRVIALFSSEKSGGLSGLRQPCVVTLKGDACG